MAEDGSIKLFITIPADEPYSPEKALWATVIETMIHDWNWCVAQKRYPNWTFIKGVTHKRSNDFRGMTPKEYEDWKKEVFVEELTEQIFLDKEEPGYLYWICMMIFGDDWELKLQKIREHILSL